MPSLTFQTADICPACQCRIRGFWIGGFRINKHSLRGDGHSGLSFREPRCPECGFESRADAGRWALDAESTDRVTAARVRKGWV